MITHLSLRDFKAFHSLDLELKPITLLLGPNNSGKSSIIAPLRLLAQTAQAQDRNLSLLLDGPLGDFGTYRDVVHGNHRGRPLAINLEGTDGDDGTWRIEVEFKFRPKRRQLVVRQAVLHDQSGHIVTVALSSEGDRHVVTHLDGRRVPSQSRSKVSEILMLQQFIPLLYAQVGRGDAKVPPSLLDASGLRALETRADQAFFGIRDSLWNTEYVGAMRMPPERTYHQTGETRARIGAAGENWTGILVLDSARPPSLSKQLGKRVNSWLNEAGLAAELSFHWLSDRHYEIMIKHPISGESQNLADVGQANSQILPVLVGGYRLEPGSTYMVEEPEIHLHPKAQAQLGDFFYELYEQGVISLVETHSEYLVLRVQQLVASGVLPSSAVAFYYVHAEHESAQKCVIPLSLDSQGRFDQALPGGFFPEHLEEARKLARIRNGVEEE
jgi:AAA ATPase domain